MNLQRIAIFCAVCITLASFAEPVTFQYGEDLTWSGELGQTVNITYSHRGETIETTGEITKVKTNFIFVDDNLIFLKDVIKVYDSNASLSNTDSEESTVDVTTESTLIKTKTKDENLSISVFMLPMEGGVGQTMRATELKELGEHIDANYDPGQIIILKVDSGGGYGATWSEIKDVIFDVRERHRVIAWIHDDAISAAAMTVYCCDEIYYTTQGKVGSCTGYLGSPHNPLPPEWQEHMWKQVEEEIVQSSRTIHLAKVMFKLDAWLSYDIDPETEQITYYPSDEGEHKLSEGNNLTITAREAKQSGLSDGTADTEEELLGLLSMQGAEINRHGEDLFHKWEKTLEDYLMSKEELLQTAQYGNQFSKNEKARIRSQIDANEKLLKWGKKLGEIAKFERSSDGRPLFGEAGIKFMKRQIRILEKDLQNVED